jgi:multimeric flavodoxin WrbA
MKVLMLNGSRRDNGCTFTALGIVASSLEAEGIESEILNVGKDAFSGKLDEIVEEVHEKMKTSDALVVGSPVYFAGPSAEIQAVLDRLFMTAEADLRLKPAAAISCARRAGTSASLDVLNKYFTYAEMPVVSSRYWNMAHGFTPADVLADEEGVQIMRVLGRNMAWVLKCIEAGKKSGVVLPAAEKKIFTNFIK